MRIGICAGAALCMALACRSARAQSGGSTVLGGAAPTALQFKPIDMTNVVVAPSLTTSQNPFSFGNIFRRLTIPGGTPLQGVSALPSPSSFPTYTNARMVGTPPYQIGNPMAARFPFLPVIPILNPVKPITPGNP